jgi:hypothetical protein
LALPVIATSIDDDAMHLILLSLSVGLVFVSANAYRRVRVGRYQLLMLAFMFFFLDQAVTTYQELYLAGAEIAIPIINLHLVHLFELLMGVSFIGALLRPSSLRLDLKRNEPR